MSTVVRNRRKTHRVRTVPGTDATVTLAHPHPGGPVHTLPLRDISSMGISFVLTDELADLELGDTYAGVVVRVEDRRVEGELVVMHLTPEGRPGAVCGAMFYPDDGGDLAPLMARLAGGGGDAAA